MRTTIKHIMALVPILLIGFLFITSSLDSAANIEGSFMFKYGLTIIIVVIVAVFGVAAVAKRGQGKQ